MRGERRSRIQQRLAWEDRDDRVEGDEGGDRKIRTRDRFEVEVGNPIALDDALYNKRGNPEDCERREGDEENSAEWRHPEAPTVWLLRLGSVRLPHSHVLARSGWPAAGRRPTAR